jgi:hypothetical protein
MAAAAIVVARMIGSRNITWTEKMRLNIPENHFNPRPRLNLWFYIT